MREIKFRAWDTFAKEMKLPTLLRLSRSLPYTNDNNNGKVNQIQCNGENHIEYFGDSYVLMQYTGLKDEKGKEIYEGDVIIGEAEIPCRVIWDMKNGCFRGNAINMSHVTIPAESFTRRKIMGNIYENADLLDLALAPSLDSNT